MANTNRFFYLFDVIAGTRRKMLCAVAFCLSGLIALTTHADGISHGMGSRDFDFIMGPVGQRACLRLPKGKDVRAILYCHQNMTEEVLFRSERFNGIMDSLGVARAFIQSGSLNWDPSTGCQQRFDSIIDGFATATGHPEIKEAAIIPFGHSAYATFPWNFAAWNPDRTLCVVSFHGDAPRTNRCGYGRANVEWGRTRNIDSIPSLMIMGEYEWWEDRIRPAMAFQMMYPESRMSVFCDAGKGHFDFCEDTQDYIAAFIGKAISNPKGTGGVRLSRWFADGHESEDPHEQFWYQDQEMADRTTRRYRESVGRKHQYLGIKSEGSLVAYRPESYPKVTVYVEGPEFTLTPVFVDEAHDAESTFHADVSPRIVLISGPAVQTGEYSFRYDSDYMGEDPERQWKDITLCVEADGDDEYKAAVQEITVRLNGHHD